MIDMTRTNELNKPRTFLEQYKFSKVTPLAKDVASWTRRTQWVQWMWQMRRMQWARRTRRTGWMWWV